MNTVTLKINGTEVTVPQGSTILEAAKAAGIRIPTLCYLKDINAIGACRMCVVEVKGARAFAAACVYPVTEGMEVFTNTPKIRTARKATLEEESLATSKEASCWTKLKRTGVSYPETKLTKRLDKIAGNFV